MSDRRVGTRVKLFCKQQKINVNIKYIKQKMEVHYGKNIRSKKTEFIINCDNDVIIPEFGIKDIEEY